MKFSHHLLLAFALAWACPIAAARAQGQVRLNEGAFHFAQQLIESVRFVADGNGSWRNHQPTVEQENEFIHAHGWSEYAKWHLAVDLSHRENSKARYKFPFGDFNDVRRSALLASRSRARQHGYSDIESAAAELQQKLERKLAAH